MEWPAKSGRQAQFPEVDRAAWFPIESAPAENPKGAGTLPRSATRQGTGHEARRTPSSPCRQTPSAPSAVAFRRRTSAIGDRVHPSESAAGREQRFVFDEVAELYARVRPTYPAALVDFVIDESGVQPGGRILELRIGPGERQRALLRPGISPALFGARRAARGCRQAATGSRQQRSSRGNDLRSVADRT